MTGFRLESGQWDSSAYVLPGDPMHSLSCRLHRDWYSCTLHLHWHTPDYPHLASSAGSYWHPSYLWQFQEILILVLKGKGGKGLFRERGSKIQSSQKERHI